MKIRRRQFVATSCATALYGSVGQFAFAESCSSNRISELKERCLMILNDIELTIQTGRNLENAAWAKGQEATGPSYECVKGSYDLGLALFKDCNPSSPGVNPVACVETLVGVLDTVQACETAVSLVREAWSLYEQASFIFGTAKVAFFDQGGGEIAAELDKCGEPSCLMLGRGISEYAQQNQERALRNRDRLKDHENQINELRDRLERCRQDSNSCVELPQYQFPALEPTDAGPPDINLN